MKVTGVKFDLVAPQDVGLCARASVIFDSCLAVHDVRILKGKGGLCVIYPNKGFKTDSDGRKKYMDIVHPINNSFSKEVESEVLSAYKKVIEKNI